MNKKNKKDLTLDDEKLLKEELEYEKKMNKLMENIIRKHKKNPQKYI